MRVVVRKFFVFDQKVAQHLEDTMQYILAKKAGCDLIISNDHNFASFDIELMRSEVLCENIE